MDKRLVLAKAGSGKTTCIVSSLSSDEKVLIVTYTNNNHVNLREKIAIKFGGEIPANIRILTYFDFLYSFCYKPFLSDYWTLRGFNFNHDAMRDARRFGIGHPFYYMDERNRVYGGRLALLMMKGWRAANMSEKEWGVIEGIQARIKKYFDRFIIDEVQDIGGYDFELLDMIMGIDVDMLFVGDFHQHTYSTSQDGNINKNLYDDIDKYSERFKKKGVKVDDTSLLGSWRCSPAACDFIRSSLGISILSNQGEEEDSEVIYLTEESEVARVLKDENIVKLHYNSASNYFGSHQNWGEVKGLDCYEDVCVLLTQNVADAYENSTFDKIGTATKRKLYVAITRAKKNVYLISPQYAREQLLLIKKG